MKTTEIKKLARTVKPQTAFDLTLFTIDVKTTLNNRWILGKKPSLRPLSKITGISIATLSRVINQGKMPELETFGKLCKWMGVEPNNYFNL
jgi:DNA-binding Xre family transcriptional regulator